MDKFWKALLFFFIGCVFLAVMTHASGFATAAGTMFSGVNTLGQTLEGNNSSA